MICYFGLSMRSCWNVWPTVRALCALDGMDEAVGDVGDGWVCVFVREWGVVGGSGLGGCLVWGAVGSGRS